MKFNVSGIRTRTITTVITELLHDCEVDVTKAEVMRVTGCSGTIDGDSHGWYSYVEEALDNRANAKISTSQEKELTDILEGDEGTIRSMESGNVFEIVDCIDVEFSDSHYGYAEVEKTVTEKQEFEVTEVNWY